MGNISKLVELFLFQDVKDDKIFYNLGEELGASQVALLVKNPPANVGDVRDTGSMPELGRSHGGGHGHPLQYSCPENPVDRGTRCATVLGVAKSWTPLELMHTGERLQEKGREQFWFHGASYCLNFIDNYSNINFI